MRYPFKDRMYEIKHWRTGFRIISTTGRGTVTYHLAPLPNILEARKLKAYLESISVIEAKGITKGGFTQFYGCNNCDDARNAHLEPIGNVDGEHARYCIHKECPYADEIERSKNEYGL